MRLNPVLVAFVFRNVSKIDLSSSVGSDDLLSYDFATGTMRGYLVEISVSVKREQVDDGSVVFELESTANVNRPPGISRWTISNVESEYWR